MPQPKGRPQFWQGPNANDTQTDYDKFLAEIDKDPARQFIIADATRLRMLGIDLTQGDLLARVVERARREHAAYVEKLQTLTPRQRLDEERRFTGFDGAARRSAGWTSDREDKVAVEEEAANLKVGKHEAVVYYIQMGGLIKIGTSTNIRRRFESINPQRVLGVERGGPVAERARHRQFAHLRTHGEWFDGTDELRAHIKSVSAEFEQHAGCNVERWLAKHLPTVWHARIGFAD